MSPAPIFLVLLRLEGQGSPSAMAEHTAWLQRGFADGVFALVGSLEEGRGGAILVHGLSRAALTERLGEDPLVAQGLAATEVIAVSPRRSDPRLAFLLGA